MRTLAFLAALTTLATGCNTVRLADTVDLTFDWSPLPSDELHTPYVAGADFGLFTIGADEDETVGWTLESDDPSILRVDSTENGGADVTAVGAGETAVRILDERGELVHAAPIDVRQADRAELFAHGGLILGRPELQEDWDEIYVLAGGSATFEVRWFEGATRLFGHGALTASAGADIVVAPRRTFLFEDREWITFTPLTPGEHDVELFANGVSVRTVRVIAVTEDAIAEVQLHGMDESSARRGDLLTVLAQAYDAEGRAVFGVEYAWDLDGATQLGEGDLFRYALTPGVRRMLTAQHEGLEVQVEIQAEDGFVDSTNRLGCTAAPGVATGAPLAPALLFAALAALRLRRRR